jgi:hypothetical protein
LGRATHKDSSKIKFVFCEVSTIFYKFWKFELIYGIFKTITKFGKIEKWPNSAEPHSAHACSTHRLAACNRGRLKQLCGPAQLAQPMPIGMLSVCPWGGGCDPAAHSGAVAEGSAVAGSQYGIHP